MKRHVAPARARLAAAMLVALSALVAGCSSDDSEPQAAGESPAPVEESPTKSEATVALNVEDARGPVTVDEALEVAADNGSLEKVEVRTGAETLRGKLSEDKTTWSATERLEPGLRYRVVAVAVDGEGLRTTKRSSFRTEALSLERQTYPSIAPLQGETVGVGMPVIVHFDVPVTDRASIERHLSVTSTPKQAGSWRWISSQEVHWRPAKYWKPGTKVRVDADINSVPAGDGIYGQLSRSVTFDVGDSIISKVDVQAHRMRVLVNGKLARTVPISAGKPGFITRSGTKIIIEKQRHKVMDAESIGISKNDPEYYRLDVYYAMRVTYSGEFLHAAPWSTGSQGLENVSHGCVGMTTENASWLFGITHGRGDVVEVSGSDRHMTLENGYGDWTLPFQEYAEGSALS